jgi:hypothetical protein
MGGSPGLSILGCPATTIPNLSRSGIHRWDGFRHWVTSTGNRLDVGWFGALMIPALLKATVWFLKAFLGRPHNVHNFARDLAAAARTPVPLMAPPIGW